MKTRLLWGKMGFSRCAPFTIRCATQTGAPAGIITTTTLRECTSTRENITCDFPLFFPWTSSYMFTLRLGRETEDSGSYFILSHIKQSQFMCIRSRDEWLGASSNSLSFIKSFLATSCVCELDSSFVCFCADSV